MAIRRQQNWLSQQRVDLSHMRSIESAVANDFDEMLRGLVTGEGRGLIVRGFKINMTGAIGSASNGLQLLVANSAILHGTSAQAGTFYTVPTGTVPEVLNSTVNTKVSGAFTANAVNYIGLEYERIVDDATSDQIYIWNPTNKNETTKTAPLAKILRYKIVITTSLWASNVLPVAKVTTDVANNVVDITDQRDMLGRLGKAGVSTPNPSYVYPWIDGRQEVSATSTVSTSDPFSGGDKQLESLKQWMDAIMSSILEIKGTVYWYSPNVGGSAVNLRADLGNTVFTGRGNVTHSATVAGRLNWSQDVFTRVIGSRLGYKIIANAASTDVTLADDQVAYINLVRGVSIVPNLIFINSGAIVSSVGSVSWTSGLVAGDWLKLASVDDSQYYKIQSVDSLSQVTLTEVYGGLSSGPSGLKAKYAWGVYQTNPTPSTNRHIKIAARKDVPLSEDIFWLFLRDDNAGTLPRVYARFVGAEIEQGESKDINDSTSDQVLQYMGATSEHDFQPSYSTQLGILATEVTSITTPAASSITSGQKLTINSANDIQKFYVWYRKDAVGTDPAILGRIPIVVDIVTGDTDSQVATKTALALDALAAFSATEVGPVITVTNSQAGATTDAANVDVTGLTVSVTTQGVGYPNNIVADAENLTLSIKQLDKAVGSILLSIAKKDYDEATLLAAPVLANTNISIPTDSRNSFAVRTFIVGNGDLEVYLNGVKQFLGVDWVEIGSSGAESNTIQFLFNLVAGDWLMYRIEPTVSTGMSSGSGEANTASNQGTGAGVFISKVGIDLQFRRLKAGAGVTVTENATDITLSSTPTAALLAVQTITSSNYTMTVANDVVLAANAGVDVTVTLPSAVGIAGKVFYIKKIDAGNTMYIASVLSQTVDGVNRTASPLAVTVLDEVVTIVSDGTSWRVL